MKKETCPIGDYRKQQLKAIYKYIDLTYFVEYDKSNQDSVDLKNSIKGSLPTEEINFFVDQMNKLIHEKISSNPKQSFLIMTPPTKPNKLNQIFNLGGWFNNLNVPIKTEKPVLARPHEIRPLPLAHIPRCWCPEWDWYGWREWNAPWLCLIRIGL